MRKLIGSSLLMTSITGCVGMQSAPEAGPPAACRDAELPHFIGTKATSISGAGLLKASGARNLRWVGPGMAVTMDYRPDRLTVSYDEDMVILSARCG